MNARIPLILATATPAGGALIPVRPNGLIGSVYLGQFGPATTLEFTGTGGSGTWQTLVPGYAFQTTGTLRLTRTDTSATATTIEMTAPVQGLSEIQGTLDGEGYLILNGGPTVTPKDLAVNLASRLASLEGGGDGGGGGGPIVLSQGLGADNLGRISGAGTNIPLRRLSIRANNIPLQVIDQILINAVQAPPGSLQLIGMYDPNGVPLYEGSPLGMTSNFLGTTVQIPPLLFGNPFDELMLLFNVDVPAPAYSVSQAGASITVRAEDQYNNSLNGMVGVQIQAAAAGALAGPVTHYSLPIVRAATVDPPRGGYWEVVAPDGVPPRIRFSDGFSWFGVALTQE